jgi:cyclase
VFPFPLRDVCTAALAGLVLLAAGSAAPSAAPDAPSRGFRVEEVGAGVHALVRTKPVGFLNDCNVVFIINDDDVVVVDTNLTPASAEASIAALRRLTSKPVRFVVNTHWHVDHVSGNQVYRREYPGVEFIGHRQVREDLLAKGATNRRDMGEQGRQFAETMRQQVADGESLTGAAISDAERASYAADLALIDELVGAIPAIEIVPPTLVVDDRLRLIRGRRTIDIVRLGRSHTHGDLAVVLPDEGVVVTGDLLTGPIPIVGGDQSFVADWIGSLEHLLELPARVFVPGHGPVYRDQAQARLLRDFLKQVDAHATSAIARGLSLDEARQTLDVEAFRTAMAGKDQALRVLFSNYGSGPALTAAFRERAR